MKRKSKAVIVPYFLQPFVPDKRINHKQVQALNEKLQSSEEKQRAINDSKPIKPEEFYKTIDQVLAKIKKAKFRPKNRGKK